MRWTIFLLWLKQIRLCCQARWLSLNLVHMFFNILFLTSPEFVFECFSYSTTHFYNSQNIKKLWNDKSKEILLCSLLFNFFLHQKSFGFFFLTLSEGNMHTQVLKRIVVNVSAFVVSIKRKRPLKKDYSILNFLPRRNIVWIPNSC